MATLTLGALAGCASIQPQARTHAYRVTNADPAVTGDAIDVMVKVFPPALTPLSVAPADGDAFGQSLLAGLRERGYAVAERRGSGRNAVVAGAAFHYRLAPIVDSGMYELVLTVGDARLSRLYIFDTTQSRLTPGGEWSRKE